MYVYYILKLVISSLQVTKTLCYKNTTLFMAFFPGQLGKSASLCEVEAANRLSLLFYSPAVLCLHIRHLVKFISSNLVSVNMVGEINKFLCCSRRSQLAVANQ